MAKITIIKEQTWPYLEKVVVFLINSREEAREDVDLNVGINYSIILHTACYVEGVLEAGLKAILNQRKTILNSTDIQDFYTRRTTNVLHNAFYKDIENKISRTTGIKNYSSVFKLLTEKEISDYPSVKPLMEGINVLFQFRNVLAHGREVTTELVSAYWIEEEFREYFNGGYKKAEDYLIKKNLVHKTFKECDSVEVYFTDEVADHFWSLAQEFINELVSSLDQDLRDEFMNILNR